MKRFLLILSILVLMLSLSSCNKGENINSSKNEIKAENDDNKEGLNTKYPITLEVFDNKGNSYNQTYEKMPEKVITNNQASTELLLELGLEKYMIGTGDIDNNIPSHLKESYDKIPVIAEKGQVAKEAVIGANPDIIIGRAMSFEDDKYGSIKTLNDMGINTYVQQASRMKIEQSLNNIMLDVRNIGKIFNVQEKANKIATSLEDRLKNITEKMSGTNTEPLKVVFMVKYENGAFNVFGADSSLQTKMLETINAVNVVEKGGQLSSENLVSLNPDAIVYVTANKNESSDKTAIDDMRNNDTIKEVSAIKNNKIVSIEYTEVMGYGIRTFDGMEKIAETLYPEKF